MYHFGEEPTDANAAAPKTMQKQSLQLFLTIEHPCGYFAGRMSRNLVPDPKVPMNNQLYGQLIQYGFRRSGAQTYTPHCDDCLQCIPCRIPVTAFSPSRNQRRCLKKNADLEAHIAEARFTEEYFSLYRDYLNARHHDGDMANPDKEEFSLFLFSDWSETVFIELRRRQRLLAVAVTDLTRTGPSAVYTFFDPDQAGRSLGTFSILQQIRLAEQRQEPYLYMGYWIDGCRKMQYKENFRPMEYFQQGQWQGDASGVPGSPA